MKNILHCLAAAACLIQLGATAQSPYQNDRVYSANQVSNTVSVVDPATNTFLGEIKLGNPYPNALSPLYKGQALVHGLGYSAIKKVLAIVSIGSNSVTLLSTEDNRILKTIYVGRSPHEATFTPDGRQVWVTIRGESYISVIDIARMAEIKQVPVADGPGMVTFTPDGKFAYICSSFTPVVDIVKTSTYEIIKKIPVTSPFSPNIYTSMDGKLVALTHKDVGKVTIINTAAMVVEKVISTGQLTNHVTFCKVNNQLMMLVTVGGENSVKVFDVSQDYALVQTIKVGSIPHGLWPSPDGKLVYVGLEYSDQVQGIDLQTMQVISTIPTGQSPQALVYASQAVTRGSGRNGLSTLTDTAATQVITLRSVASDGSAAGRLAIRSIGLADLVEQLFTNLAPNTGYTLALTKSSSAPYNIDYAINSFTTNEHGRYTGQSTGLVKSVQKTTSSQPFQYVIVINNKSKEVVLVDKE